jgi:TonB family protein
MNAGGVFVGIAVETVLRSAILAVLSGLAVWLLRRRTAAFRFMLWQWTLIALLALPVLIRITPPVFKSSGAASRLETAVTTVDRSPVPPTISSVPAKTSPPAVVGIAAVYLLVTLMLLARFGHSLRRLRHIAARSEFIPDAPFRELANEIWLESGAFLKPRLASSSEISVPVTFDAEDIWILLPPSWRTWDEAKLRAVLTHEMAHVERRDSANLTLASFAICLFWFHPLSWFLRRQMSALAEEACDEVVLTNVAAPEQYASLLIDFADEVRRWHGRVMAEATGVVRGSVLQRRIEKLFEAKPSAQRGRKALTALAMAMFVPALYLTAAARFAEPQSQPKMVWPHWQQVSGLSDADVTALEAKLQSNPEDLDTRMELLVYFGRNMKEQQFATQLLWFIQHHPDTFSMPMAQGMFGTKLSETSVEQIRTAWEEAIAQHAGSPAVLVNAASFLERTDPERGLQLLREAQALDPIPNHHEQEIGVIYAAAELQAFRPEARLNNIQMSLETATKLRAEVESSADAALLTTVGRTLVQLNLPGQGGEEQTNHGIALIRQAITLDPSNPKWTAALEDALSEPERRKAFERLRTEPPKPGLVRIGAAVAEASLVSKTEPVYPPLALNARIQGSVEFTATIGTDGKVENLELVRGHPLLVNAAKDAVLKWVYHSATQDGEAIPFVTQVIVPFRLSE